MQPFCPAARDRVQLGNGSQVPQSSAGPGSVVADRFRLEDLLEETSGARFWRARDLTLARDVAVHVVPASDRRAPALLTAARTSALVSDGHILRVLDAVEQDDLVFVVHEYGSGLSLDRMLLEQGVLDPRRAVWLVREVAEAIVAGHGMGVAHGRLVPENVMVTEAGSVKLIGFVVSRVLHGRPDGEGPDGTDGADGLSEHETDVLNLGALLYACLVGRWPGVPGSVVPDAPRAHGRVLRPRQVKAGVPRSLDTLCGQILAGPSHTGRSEDPRFESAVEVVEALSRWLGDGAGSVVTPGTALTGPTAYVDPAAAPGPGAADPEATQASPLARPDETARHAALGPVDPVEDPTLDTPVPPPVRHTEHPPTPPPARPAPPRSPLAWGPDALRDSGDLGDLGRRGGTPAGPGGPGGAGAAASSRGDRPGSLWLRLAALVAVLTLIVLGVTVIFGLGSARDGDDEPTPDQTGQPRETSEVLPVSAVSDLDPPSQGGNGEERPEEAANAADDDPATTWTTQTYFDGPRLAPFKQGVGLVLDLGEERSVGSVVATLEGQGYAFDVYVAEAGAAAPTDIAGLQRVARESGAGGEVPVSFDPVTTRYVVLWLTALPAADGGYRGSVAEIVVRS